MLDAMHRTPALHNSMRGNYVAAILSHHTTTSVLLLLLLIGCKEPVVMALHLLLLQVQNTNDTI